MWVAQLRASRANSISNIVMTGPEVVLAWLAVGTVFNEKRLPPAMVKVHHGAIWRNESPALKLVRVRAARATMIL